MYYEFISSVTFAFMAGAFLMLLSRVIYTEKLHARQIEKSQECLKKAETELVNRVIEFDDITQCLTPFFS